MWEKVSRSIRFMRLRERSLRNNIEKQHIKNNNSNNNTVIENLMYFLDIVIKQMFRQTATFLRTL